MRQKLYHKNYLPEEIDQVINRLLSNGYVNDAVFANNLFAKYLRLKKYSLNIIICKLKQHGISDHIIKEVTYEYNYDEECSSALKLVRNRFKQSETIDKEKLYRFLGTRGFSTATINNVLKNYNHDELD